MDSAIAVAAIVTGVPVVTLLLTGWQQRLGKKQDYARQDAVAAQAAQAAQLLLESNRRVERQTAVTSERVDGKLNQIHELVNSTLSEALSGQLAILRELLAAKLDSARPDPQDLVDIRARIADLERKLSDRARRTVVADAQVPTVGDNT